MNIDDRIIWRASQGDDVRRCNLDCRCEYDSNGNCEVHEYLRRRCHDIAAAIHVRGYDGWFVNCPSDVGRILPSCVDRNDFLDLPEVGTVHSIWFKGESALVTYQSGLHIWHVGHIDDLPNTQPANSVKEDPQETSPLEERRILVASEVRRAINHDDVVRYELIWRADPEMENGFYRRSVNPAFTCSEILHESAYGTLIASVAADECARRDSAATRLAWKGGANGRSRPIPSIHHQRLCEKLQASSLDPIERNVVEHAQTYTCLMLPMTADPCCVALVVTLGLTGYTDDHREHTVISESGPLPKVIDTFRRWRTTGAWNSIDGVICVSQVNELMRELQLYHTQLSYRSTTVSDWYGFALRRACMLALHPIIELVASMGDSAVLPHHYELAQMAATISHDLLDVRYDVSKGICINSVYVLGSALRNGECPECVAECLILMVVYILLDVRTSECTHLAAAVAGCGVPRSYAFGMFRDLLNARGSHLEPRCGDAWADAIQVLEECVPEVDIDQLRSSSYDDVCSRIVNSTQGFISRASDGDNLIEEATLAAVSETSSAEIVDNLWKSCIDEFAVALIDYLDGDAERLTGLTWSAFIHGSRMRINMRCGSIRHGANIADRIPDWDCVLARHTAVPA